jgi:hypothetical protein
MKFHRPRKQVFGLFLNLSKAFDVVDHSLMLKKFLEIGIGWKAFDWLSSFLLFRKQSVKISYVDSDTCLRSCYSQPSWVRTGVPQGSVLGPLLFLIFINNISRSLVGNHHLCLFADDTSLVVSAPVREELEISTYLQGSSLIQWLSRNFLSVNTLKTKLIDFHIRDTTGFSRSQSFLLDEAEISPCQEVTYLGLRIDERLRFSNHIDYVLKKLSSGIFLLRRLSRFSNIEVLLTSYYGCLYPFMSYCVPVWGSENNKSHSVFVMQKRALRVILGFNNTESCKTHFKSNNLLTFPSIYILESLIFLKRNSHLFTSHILASHSYNLRNRNRIPPIIHHTTFSTTQMHQSCITLFNALPLKLKNEQRVNVFKRDLKGFLLNKEYYSVRDYLLDPNKEN